MPETDFEKQLRYRDFKRDFEFFCRIYDGVFAEIIRQMEEKLKRAEIRP